MIFMPMIFEHQGAIKEISHLNDSKKMIHHSHYQKNSTISICESRVLLPTESRILQHPKIILTESRIQQPEIKGAKQKVHFIFPEYIDINGNPQPNPEYVDINANRNR